LHLAKWVIAFRSEAALMDGAEHPVVFELKNEILRRTNSIAKYNAALAGARTMNGHKITPVWSSTKPL
jgi:hypothetical protein